ncbi:pyridine nucleotide-disulfide oxidoreductase [Mycobacteroides sp. H001]|uniref:pyridine nucleotide-disulfide oxidoreductase n=1 Tax=Mycobacteroides TaxID=670516 RepID=UPI000714B81F|nr:MULTISPECIES: pyridine nucleotide-disulfide oxidoreductase [Mycobacteroides]KRQ30656.1 pyridine nucleotide-disulfide oxidoreductase [Mycobacteroides sp. H072]KRQ32193.1 pyridine nucleotide-disulfide oxidoreductase [Mycobacteroides sp. H002]KRQ50089.1 pyridine nucleotide-disulfide oxidoreductase [Mycobacteroides sp. H054]KRQ67567.1 pyridine nucleotide-disulfide oxidoreductase [Mycobacteroides sp. H001]OHU44085.1 pyridine nucleotide-disulfide oxidoreductase [Mycobacteroides chelonae]
MSEYGWTVVGAGPAGIAAVGKLLDRGVPSGSIAWIDPEFAAGDFGTKWRAVHSNTSVKLFINYLTDAQSFRFAHAPHFALNDLAPTDTCLLGDVADPLVWITGQLREQVSALRTTATGLSLHGGRWTVETEMGGITSKNVILAVGSVPKNLDYPWLNEIPLEAALNPEKLAALPLEGATVAVFGASHSSMIALPNLLAGPAAKVINFYRGPLRYAVDMGDWTLFDDTGLKGEAARWARENIDGVLPARLQRCLVDSREFPELLQSCDYAVYTVGFSPRPVPAAPQWGKLEYNPANGIIAPGLFGVGIAFPEYRIDPMGFGEHRVGLQKFMDRLNKVLPLWLKYGS